MTSADPAAALATMHWPVGAYRLAPTLDGGQAFRWRRTPQGWEGVVQERWVRLRELSDGIEAAALAPLHDWSWLRRYLQIDIDLDGVWRTLPDDPALQAAYRNCRGLRLLRQDPWECLGSFLLSSTKRIQQIQQIVERLCLRFGAAIPTPPGSEPRHAFPRPEALATAGEAALRACGMGFRAAHLHAAAARIARGEFDLAALDSMPFAAARARLQSLSGVGPKIADCVLLFATRHTVAFPIDVWVARALRENYSVPDPEKLRALQAFAAEHFGPNAGYAQQYLFHYTRLRAQFSD